MMREKLFSSQNSLRMEIRPEQWAARLQEPVSETAQRGKARQSDQEPRLIVSKFAERED